MKACTSCGEDIHPKRLEIFPNATRCVKCSSVDKKAGITVTKGEGDHTYTETVIMERSEFNEFQEAERKFNKTDFDVIPSEYPDTFIPQTEDGETLPELED